jgi:drug/metabolite transporter (DMT)-like permease
MILGSEMMYDIFRSFSTTFMLGTVFLIGSALLNAINQVYYAKYVQEISPFTFTFVSFFVTSITFNVISLFSKKNKNSIRRLSSKDRMNFISLNGWTAIIFICFFFALKYVEPAIVSAIEIGVGPLLALFIGKWLYPQHTASKVEFLIGIGILIGSIVLFWASLTGHSGIEMISIDLTVKGLIASTISGIGAVLAAIYSKRLSDSGWSSTQILAHRFYAILPITAILALIQDSLYLTVLENGKWILFITITGVILPLYMLQIGIRFCHPFFVMITTTLVPVFTFIFQLFDPRIKWSNTSLIGIVLILFFALLSVISEKWRD